MAKREDEKKKRAEDPAEEGDLDTSSDRDGDDEEEGARASADEPDAGEGDEPEGDDSDDDDSDDDDSDDDDSEEENASDEDEASEDEEEDDKAAASEEEDDANESAAEGETKAAAEEAEEEDDGAPPAQLGTQRYVLSAFFGGALLLAYLLGRAIDGIWLSLATRDWLVERAPVIASVPDENKALYATLAGGVIALVFAIRTSRKPEVRQWSDDVSSELLKVKWPTRKEVYASTVVVLTTSAVAVVYLFLLDRFWGFVTNQIYGTGV